MSLLNAKQLPFDPTWATLEAHIEPLVDNFYEISKSISVDSWRELYTNVFQLCSQPLEPMPDQLYFSLKALLQRIVTSVAVQLKNHDCGEVLLREYNKKWKSYSTGLVYVNSIFEYLNRWWIKRHCELDGHLPMTGVFPVSTLGMYLWRETCIKSCLQDLFNAIIGYVNSERSGEIIQHDVLRDVLVSLITLSSTSPNQSMSLYTEFETSFLAATEEFYSAEGWQLISQTSVAEYLEHVESRLQAEEQASAHYLHNSSMSKITASVAKGFLEPHLESLYEVVRVFIVADSRLDLGRMYRLLSLVPSGLKPMQLIFRAYVEQLGEEALAKHGELINDQNQDVQPSDIKDFAQTVIGLHQHYACLIEECFAGDAGFGCTLETACRKILASSTQAPEMLAKYAHLLLEADSKAGPDDLSHSLSNLNNVLRYLDDKDVFQSFYAKCLGRRLIFGTSVSIDAEETMILHLKQSCGLEYTAKLQRMFMDQALCTSLNDSFRATLAAPLPVDFSAMVLTTGSWPLSSTTSAFVLPEEMSRCIADFQQFYNSKHTGRRLNWLHQLSRVDLRMLYLPKRYDIQVSAMQWALLQQFDHQTTRTKPELMDITSLSAQELERNLKALLKAGLLVQKDESLEINLCFSSKRSRIKLAALFQSDTKVENQTTHKHIQEDRKILLQAAAVRVMKARKELDHTNLVMEIVSEVKHRFTPSMGDIKKCVGLLIDKEYLERLESERNIYRYIA